MDLDELKQKWAVHDRKLDALLRLNRRLLTASTMNRARSALQRLAISLALESAVWFALIVALGIFIYNTCYSSPVCIARSLIGPVRDCELDCRDSTDCGRP